MTATEKQLRTRRNVAVVGAGPAGITTARELQREGHNVTVFEQMSDIGGVWLSDEESEGAVPGTRPEQKRVHTSLYDSLRTNLPRELMSFADFPFLPEYMKGRSVDNRRFPHHKEVQQYLYAFVQHYQIRPLMRFNTCVVSVRLCTSSGTAVENSNTKWEVVTVPATPDGSSEHGASVGVYDAVAVANGHYSVPRIAQLDGMDTYPAQVEHSHLYRRPEAYSGKRVLVVGTYISGAAPHLQGEDIAWDLAQCADLVVMSGKKWIKEEFSQMSAPFGAKGNMLRRPWVRKMHSNGKVEFEDGSSVESMDFVMFCTGYHNAVPFLDKSIVDTSDGHVRPLFQHMLHPQFGASLSFVGLPATVASFHQFELQARLIARLLSGRVPTPSQEEMERWMKAHYRALEEAGVPGRHVHKQAGAQFVYNDVVAAMSDAPCPPAWRKALWDQTMAMWTKYAPNEFRDQWEDPKVIAMAHADLTQRLHQS